MLHLNNHFNNYKDMNKMIRVQKNINLILPLIICSAFILCAATGMFLYPDTFHKFFSPTQITREIPPQLPHKSYYWDVLHYAEMTIKPICTAFYPLWPFLIRNIFHPETIEQAAHYFVIVGSGIFLITNFLLFWVCKTALNRTYLAFLIILAYTLNPMAIFRVNGYTESIFSLFSTLFIWLSLPNNKLNKNIKICFLFMITFLMSLTRPILIQIFFATTFTLITIMGLEILRSNIYSQNSLLITLRKYHLEIKTTITIWVASLLGYSVYGSFCWQTRDNFFAPFDDQSMWGKKLGVHLELLLFPKSPLIDIIGLYLPWIILCLSLIFTYYKFAQKQDILSVPEYRIWWSIFYLYPPIVILIYSYNLIKLAKSKINLSNIKLPAYANSLAVNYVFWVCVYFAVANSLIQFLTYDRLLSLGRYVFSTPFFFIALGYLYRCIPGKIKYKTLLFMSFISAVMLIQQWVNYGQDKWMG